MAETKLIKLRVESRDTAPPIWRRIAVPESLNLHDLHLVLQEAFGWTNSHLHDFRTKTQRFTAKSDDAVDAMFDDEDAGELPEDEFTIGQVLKEKGARMLYTYDFGDSWEHLITHQGSCAEGEVDGLVAVLAGARACPPEDCGGIGGYENLLEAMKNPKHPEREDLIEWLGGDPFDPEAFNLGVANVRVRRLLRPARKTAARPRRTARGKHRS